MKLSIGQKEYFRDQKIAYEGKESDHPLAFKILWREAAKWKETMGDNFRFAIATGTPYAELVGEPFGGPTKNCPWLQAMIQSIAKTKGLDASLWIHYHIGAPSIASDYESLMRLQHSKNQKRDLKNSLLTQTQKQKESGVKYWGTRSIF